MPLYPPPPDSSLPEHGVYVVFSIDYTNSLAFLKDSQSKLWAEELDRSKKIYVGCILDTFGKSSREPPWTYCAVSLLYRDLPDTFNTNSPFATPGMSFPVFPNTFDPLARDPLHPSLPLPWADGYHSSFGIVSCRVHSTAADQSQAISLTPDSMRRMQCTGGEDREIAFTRLLEANLKAAMRTSDIDVCSTLRGVSDAWPEANHTVENLLTASPDSSDNGDKKNPLLEDIPYDPTDPLVNIDYDLSAIDDFGSPADFFIELESFRTVINMATRCQREDEIRPNTATSDEATLCSNATEGNKRHIERLQISWVLYQTFGAGCAERRGASGG
ncbi:hypothetical protein HGRIS_012225 [Hohenbuehelia grisea]|uniref:Uncharacterized protein n=1 Tax=Hohenbuehelia grisea TaxID=104357 RepID=A0ABR3IRM2_9AGAR